MWDILGEMCIKLVPFFCRWFAVGMIVLVNLPFIFQWIPMYVGYILKMKSAPNSKAALSIQSPKNAHYGVTMTNTGLKMTAPIESGVSI